MLIKKTTLPSGLIILEATPAGGVPDPQDSLQPVLGPDEEALADSISALNSNVSTLLASTGVAVATASALTTLDNTVMNDGSLVWVQSRKRYFTLDKASSVAATSGEVVLTKSGAGRFLSVDATTSFEWSTVAAWFVDPANASGTASDDNDGQSAATALRTGEELERRLGKGLYRAINCTVTVLSSGLNLPLHGIIGSMIVSAAATAITAIFNGVLTSQTAIVRTPGPGNPQLIEAAGLPGTWTALGGIDARIRLTNGAHAGAVAWIMKDNGGANHQAETSPFVDAGGTQVTPAGNETFIVETLPDVGTLAIDGTESFNDLFVMLIGFRSPGAQNDIAGGTVIALGSKFTTNVVPKGTAFLEMLGCWNDFVSCEDASTVWVMSCGQTKDVVGGLATPSAWRVAGDTYVRDHDLFTNASQNNRIGPVFFSNTNHRLIDCSVSASTGSMGGGFSCEGIIYGSTTLAASEGVLLGQGSRVSLGGIVNTFTSPGANWKFGSVGKSHAQLPFVDQFNVGAGPVANANMAQVL